MSSYSKIFHTPINFPIINNSESHQICNLIKNNQKGEETYMIIFYKYNNININESCEDIYYPIDNWIILPENKDKFLFLSGNTIDDIKDIIKHILHVSDINEYNIYINSKIIMINVLSKNFYNLQDIGKWQHNYLFVHSSTWNKQLSMEIFEDKKNCNLNQTLLRTKFKIQKKQIYYRDILKIILKNEK